MLKHLFVMDPMEGISVDKDTTFVFMREAQRRGHALWHCLPQDLSVVEGQVTARCRRVEVNAQQGSHFHFGAGETIATEQFDALFMRKDPPFDMAYVVATYLLEQVPARTLVFNRPDSLRSANEKLYSLRFPEVIPPSIVTCHKAEAREFTLAQGGLAVIKPLDGAGGEGVFLLRQEDPNFNVIVETVTSHGRKWAVVQRFLPEIHETGDKRIILLDGEPLGAIARLPSGGDLRGNIHVGGRVQPAPLTPRDIEICERLAPTLRKDGLWFVGLDVIGGYLTEVNVTSPTGVQEMNRFLGVHLEERVIDFVEAKCASLRSQ